MTLKQGSLNLGCPITSLHDITAQKTTIWKFTAVKISDLAAGNFTVRQSFTLSMDWSACESK
jgi:hypothetical protein